VNLPATKLQPATGDTDVHGAVPQSKPEPVFFPTQVDVADDDNVSHNSSIAQMLMIVPMLRARHLIEFGTLKTVIFLVRLS
jgi:hypothetical protein